LVLAAEKSRVVSGRSHGRAARMAKTTAAYSLDVEFVERIKRQSTDTDVPQSRIVNRILAAHFRAAKADA
jgi:hypothetical protein